MSSHGSFNPVCSCNTGTWVLTQDLSHLESSRRLPDKLLVDLGGAYTRQMGSERDQEWLRSDLFILVVHH